jgi:hypothetical protein
MQPIATFDYATARRTPTAAPADTPRLEFPYAHA